MKVFLTKIVLLLLVLFLDGIEGFNTSIRIPSVVASNLWKSNKKRYNSNYNNNYNNNNNNPRYHYHYDDHHRRYTTSTLLSSSLLSLSSSSSSSSSSASSSSFSSILSNGNHFWINVETFDGSTIVDPVVISNTYWVNLKSQLTSLVIGSTLAAIVFVVVVSFASSQMMTIRDSMLYDSFVQPQQEQPQQSTRRNQLGNSSSSSSSSNTTGTTINVIKLIVSIVIDIIGDALPEVFDIVWAPIAAIALQSMYSSSTVFVLELLEEIIPFTDIIPLATICWIVDTFFRESTVAQVLQIGTFSSFDDDRRVNLITKTTTPKDDEDDDLATTTRS